MLANEVFFADGTVEKDAEYLWKTILAPGRLELTPGPGGKRLEKPLIIVEGNSDDPTKEVGLQDLWDAFEDGAKQHVTIPTTHENNVLENTGFIRKLRWGNENGQKVLQAAFEFTEPSVKEMVERGTIADVSCGILRNYRKQRNGKLYASVLEHVNLTNNPWVDGMGSFTKLAEEDDDMEVDTYFFAEQEDRLDFGAMGTPTALPGHFFPRAKGARDDSAIVKKGWLKRKLHHHFVEVHGTVHVGDNGMHVATHHESGHISQHPTHQEARAALERAHDVHLSSHPFHDDPGQPGAHIRPSATKGRIERIKKEVAAEGHRKASIENMHKRAGLERKPKAPSKSASFPYAPHKRTKHNDRHIAKRPAEGYAGLQEMSPRDRLELASAWREALHPRGIAGLFARKAERVALEEKSRQFKRDYSSTRVAPLDRISIKRDVDAFTQHSSNLGAEEVLKLLVRKWHEDHPELSKERLTAFGTYALVYMEKGHGLNLAVMHEASKGEMFDYSAKGAIDITNEGSEQRMSWENKSSMILRQHKVEDSLDKDFPDCLLVDFTPAKVLLQDETDKYWIAGYSVDQDGEVKFHPRQEWQSFTPDKTT